MDALDGSQWIWARQASPHALSQATGSIGEAKKSVGQNRIGHGLKIRNFESRFEGITFDIEVQIPQRQQRQQRLERGKYHRQ